MSNVVKRFGTVVALNGVDFSVDRGEVHGLLGGNGAGKTTLMNCLYGLYRPDSGSIVFEGKPLTIRAPRDAIRYGIGMVHQNFLQVDTYTVTENIVLGTQVSSFPRFDLRAARKKVMDLAERYGLNVDPDKRVADLPVGVRQRVEILKALYRDARLLILDEPTTNLTPQEVDALFDSLRAIVDAGTSIILITHKIRESMTVCDRLTVMRDGQRVETLVRRETTPRELANLMVGDQAVIERVAVAVGETEPESDTVEDKAPKEPSTTKSADAESASDDEASAATTDVEAAEEAGVEEKPADAEPASADETAADTDAEAQQDAPAGPIRLRVEGIDVPGDQGAVAVHGCDLTVVSGQVLGIAGVAGNGQVELAEALAGVRRPSAGRLSVNGVDLTGRPVRDWLAAGVTYVPEDRHRDGILTTATIADNLLLGSQRTSRFSRRGVVRWRAVRRTASELITRYSVRASGHSAVAGTLSGGNIQRVILARAFSREPDVLILHNPTRGLDIGSTQFVYDRIREVTASGAAVVLISEDLDELLYLADHIVVLYNGRVVGRVPRQQADRFQLGRLMAGAEAEGREDDRP